MSQFKKKLEAGCALGGRRGNGNAMHSQTVLQASVQLIVRFRNARTSPKHGTRLAQRLTWRDQAAGDCEASLEQDLPENPDWAGR